MKVGTEHATHPLGPRATTLFAEHRAGNAQLADALRTLASMLRSS